MKIAPLPADEPARQRALDAYEIVDTLPEPEFDDLVALASKICETPIALVSLLDRDRQWFKAGLGLELGATSRDLAFCSHAILQDDVLVVRDAREDDRFADHPSVLNEPRIRFYAGAPLRTPEGQHIGTLCVIDRVPRELTAFQTQALATLARQVIAQLELRARLQQSADQHARMQAVGERDLGRAIVDRDRFFELSVDAMCVAGTDGAFKRVNAAFTRMLGYPLEELLATSLLELVHPEDLARTTVELEALAAGAPPTPELETRYRGRDGAFRTIAWTSVAVPEEGLVYAIARDVTEKRQLQEQLMQAQKMEAVGRLAGGIAHDFNNLLSVILGFSSLVQEELPEGSPVLADLAEVTRAAQRAGELTRQLLLFSRKGSTQPPRTLDLAAVVTDLDRMMRRIIGADIELRTTTAPGLWPVRAVPGQLEQVLVNLIVNARDAMPAGGTLRLESANVVVGEAYARTHADVAPGEYVRLTVRDTGTGMDHATQLKIFEPFFTTKEVGRGTGLGLATVFAIVQNAGGHIEVDSELGRGTTFQLYLPRDASDARDGTAATAAAAHGSEAILLVEDEPQVRELVRRGLERRGYRVADAASGEEALAIVERSAAFDLVITDLIMPGMRGHELVLELRRARPDLPAIVMSGYAGDVAHQQVTAQARTHFVEKPLSLSHLERLARELLDA